MPRPASTASSHIWSVGYSSILDLNKRNKLAVDRTAGRIDAEEPARLYEVEGFDTVIKALPTNRWPGPRRSPSGCVRSRPAPSVLEARAGDPRQSERRNSRPPCASSPSTRPRAVQALQAGPARAREVGYQKANEFIRRSSPPAAFSRRLRIRRVAWPACCCTRHLVMEFDAGCRP